MPQLRNFIICGLPIYFSSHEREAIIESKSNCHLVFWWVEEKKIIAGENGQFYDGLATHGLKIAASHSSEVLKNTKEKMAFSWVIFLRLLGFMAY